MCNVGSCLPSLGNLSNLRPLDVLAAVGSARLLGANGYSAKRGKCGRSVGARRSSIFAKTEAAVHSTSGSYSVLSRASLPQSLF
ncbi:hypothetical protein Q31a_06380 [Aureliella helgolandensis]|uniref:Uncharacterized protein n=1 Tax=Aureliella helgolandensis TaxID=2527968 RepID=A0A518G1D5_9BACT|nr:hypothetical protein Q31a_06380 [Aureliella helgolandensis]